MAVWLFGPFGPFGPFGLCDRAKMTVSRDLHCENGLLQNLTSSAMAVERCNYLKFNSAATKICIQKRREKKNTRTIHCHWISSAQSI